MTSHFVVRGAVFALPALLLACGPSPDAPPSIAEGGIAIIDTTGVQCRELFAPGDSIPPRIVTAVAGPRGLLAWHPAGMPILIIRSPDGHEARINGLDAKARFIGARQMGWLGDTLWVTDAESNRIQRYDAEGRYLGTILAPEMASWYLVAGGRLRATAPRGFNVAQGTGDTTWALIGGRPGEGHTDTLAQVGSPPWLGVSLVDRGGPNPLSFETMAAMAPSGNRWCTWLTDGGTTLRCLTGDGAPLFERRLALPRMPVSDAIYEAVVETFVTPRQNNYDSLHKYVQRPDSLPFAFAMRYAHDDALWLLRSHWSAPEQVWLRLAPDGTPRDEIHLPSRLTLLDISGDSLWVGERNTANLQRMMQCQIVH